MNEAIISHDGPGHRWLAERSSRGVQLGLARIEALLEALGRPQDGLPCALVAGTNGKGSVSAMLAGLLTEAGLKTGLYTSPHLVETRERVRVGGAAISAEALDAALVRVRDAALPLMARDGALEPTPFETLTAAGLCALREAGVEVAVLEVGLGGRLDATNVTDPLVSVLTRVGHDHGHILGKTLAAISFEKAHVARDGRPFVVAQPSLANSALRRLGRRPVVVKLGHDARVVDVAAGRPGRPASAHLIGGALDEPMLIETALPGAHQLENAALALMAYAALRGGAADGALARPLPPVSAVVHALAQTRWPARGEWLDDAPVTLLDGAHNEDGAEALAGLLGATGRRWQIILATRANRDPVDIVRPLAPHADAFLLPRMQAPTLRPPEALAEVIHREAPAATVGVASPARCLEQARRFAGDHGGVALAGSLHAVGEWLGSGLVRSPALEAILGGPPRARWAQNPLT